MMVKKYLLIFGTLTLVAALMGGTFLLGYEAGTHEPKNIIVRGAANLEPNEPVPADFSTFWQAWQLINDEYLKNAEVANMTKVEGAIKGLVSSLGDPYSAFFNAEDNKKFQEDIQGNFGGIGAELGIRKDVVVIIAPLKNTPASRAGLRAGDMILKINSTSTEGMTIDEAVSLIRGPEGKPVTLTIFRDNWDKPREFTITRARIDLPTIDFEMKNGAIAYIQLHSFNNNATSFFYQAASKALSEGSRAVVLDVRDDPGGYLGVAVDLAGWFLPRGTLVVSEVGRNNDKQEFKATGNEALAKLPVVVLINNGSASASEILAGTLRDNRRAPLIGEQSFGKGTVQQLENLRDGNSLKLTVAHWVLPSGVIFESGGLKPDIEIEMSDEDIKNNKDPQLDKALEVARSLMK